MKREKKDYFMPRSDIEAKKNLEQAILFLHWHICWLFFNREDIFIPKFFLLDKINK